MASSICFHMCVCVCVCSPSHRCYYPRWHGRHQLLCAFNVHISPIVTLFLSRALSLLFSLSLCHTHTHKQMLPPPGVPASSAWYLANSFIGPGAQPSDHNVVRLLIFADMVQFEKGTLVPMLVITLISGYCMVHVYRSGIKLYSGLILAHKGCKWSSTLSVCTSMPGRCEYLFIEM